MVLYTPLSYDEIFPQKTADVTFVTYMGKPLYVKKNERGQLEIVQLLSTDPNDFLQSHFAPGTVLYDENVQNPL